MHGVHCVYVHASAVLWSLDLFLRFSLCVLLLSALGCAGTSADSRSSAGELWRAWGISLPAAPGSQPDARSPKLILTPDRRTLVGAPGRVSPVDRDQPLDAILPPLSQLRAEGWSGPVLLHADPGAQFQEVWHVLKDLDAHTSLAIAVAGPEGEVGAIALDPAAEAPQRHLRVRVEPGGMLIGLGEAGADELHALLESDDHPCLTFAWADRERQPYEELMRSVGTIVRRNGLTAAVLEAPGQMSWGRVAEVAAWLQYRMLPLGARLILSAGAERQDCSSLRRERDLESLGF